MKCRAGRMDPEDSVTVLTNSPNRAKVLRVVALPVTVLISLLELSYLPPRPSTEETQSLGNFLLFLVCC